MLNSQKVTISNFAFATFNYNPPFKSATFTVHGNYIYSFTLYSTDEP